MSGTHLKGTHEVVTKGGGPTETFPQNSQIKSMERTPFSILNISLEINTEAKW